MGDKISVPVPISSSCRLIRAAELNSVVPWERYRSDSSQPKLDRVLNVAEVLKVELVAGRTTSSQEDEEVLDTAWYVDVECDSKTELLVV